MITATFAGRPTRLTQTTTFEIDKDVVDNLIIDYAGRLDTDTVSSVSVSTEDITAGTAVISSNQVTIPVSGGQEGSTARMEVTATTAAGAVIPYLIRFRVKNYYGD